MTHGIHVLGAGIEQPLRNIRIWDSGATWKDINPARGVWEWETLDQIVSQNRNYLYVLGATPQWAAKYPTAPHAAPWLGPGTNSPPADLRTWDEYVRRVVTRYKGRIRAYQVWNEPQLKHFWYPDRYTTLGTMTKRAYAIIKEIDPNALVVAAPVLPRPSSGGVKRGAKYLAALWKRDWPVDVYAIHCYPEEGYGAARVSWMVNQMAAKLKEMQAPRKALWITELNYNLLKGELPLPRQFRLIEGTDVVKMTHRVSRVYWYAYPRHSDSNLLGVTFYEGSETLEALRRLNA